LLREERKRRERKGKDRKGKERKGKEMGWEGLEMGRRAVGNE
jgi:hypothetical protein